MINCPKCKRGSWPEAGMPCPVPECGDVRGSRWVVSRIVDDGPQDYVPGALPDVAQVRLQDDVYERAVRVDKGVRYYQWHKAKTEGQS